jgi:hypothetical protein
MVVGSSNQLLTFDFIPNEMRVELSLSDQEVQLPGLTFDFSHLVVLFGSIDCFLICLALGLPLSFLVTAIVHQELETHK